MSLSFEKRKKKIMECLNKEGKVEVQALADELGVSTETIRRDLERLDQEGKLKKVYGGAVKVRADAFELPFDKKTLINAKEKAAIGRRAAALVKDGDTIMIGNGTSTLEVVRNLHSHANVTIVTHSTPVLLLAMEMFPGRIIFVGGEVNRHQRSVSGPLSELVLNRIRVNKAFISAGGVSLVDGITDYEISEANISRIMIERADEAIILADHSKLGKTTFANICSLDDVFTVITDHRCPPEWIRYLAERDVELIVADEEEGE